MALLPARPACRYRDRRIRAAVFLCYGRAVCSRRMGLALFWDGRGPGRVYSPCGSSECRARKSWKACR